MAKKPKSEIGEAVDSANSNQIDDETATDAVFAEDEFTVAAEVSHKPSRLPAMIAFTSLIISALTVAAVFYFASTGGGDDAALVATDARLDALNASVVQNEAEIRNS